jgi:hypothetical protein
MIPTPTQTSPGFCTGFTPESLQQGFNWQANFPGPGQEQVLLFLPPPDSIGVNSCAEWAQLAGTCVRRTNLDGPGTVYSCQGFSPEDAVSES